MRLRVDPIACDAHGLCVELLPEVIRLDDWGYPMIAAEHLHPDLDGLAVRAVKACPSVALHIEDDAPPGTGS